MITGSQCLGDTEIRVALRRYLEERWADCSNTEFIEELGLCRGRARIDVAVINGVFHAYEIKSDRDRLDRLPSQVDVYGKVVDRSTIVVGKRHVEAVLELLPQWWGVLLAEGRGEEVFIDLLRAAAPNPWRDPRALVELLWRDEALALLEACNADFGVRSKRRSEIWDRVCEHFCLDEIAATVRECLRRRAQNSVAPRPS